MIMQGWRAKWKTRVIEAIEGLLVLVNGVPRPEAFPTLITADVVDDARATPTPPAGPHLDDRVSRRWHELIETERLSGREVRHCISVACAGGACGIASCVCHCDGCERLSTLRARAHRDVFGRR
jgi:hypothetical protein